MEFKVGDVVRLKSGGPKMTVDYFDSDTERALCVWFKDGERKQDHFLPETLEKYERSKGPGAV